MLSTVLPVGLNLPLDPAAHMQETQRMEKMLITQSVCDQQKQAMGNSVV